MSAELLSCAMVKRLSPQMASTMRAPHFKKWFAKLPALNLPQRLQRWPPCIPLPDWTG